MRKRGFQKYKVYGPFVRFYSLRISFNDFINAVWYFLLFVPIKDKVLAVYRKKIFDPKLRNANFLS